MFLLHKNFIKFWHKKKHDLIPYTPKILGEECNKIKNVFEIKQGNQT